MEYQRKANEASRGGRWAGRMEVFHGVRVDFLGRRKGRRAGCYVNVEAEVWGDLFEAWRG